MKTIGRRFEGNIKRDIFLPSERILDGLSGERDHFDAVKREEKSFFTEKPHR